MAKEENHLKAIITGFVLVVLALAFIVSISEQTNTTITKTYVSGESQGGVGCWVRVNMSEETEAGPILAQVNETDGQFSDGDCNITLSNAPTGWKSEECVLTDVVLTNNTGDLKYTLDTDYVLDTTNGVVSLINTTTTSHWLNLSNNTLVSYYYCPDSYVVSSWGRTILGTNVGIYAIAILLVVIYLVYTLLEKKKEYED